MKAHLTMTVFMTAHVLAGRLTVNSCVCADAWTAGGASYAAPNECAPQAGTVGPWCMVVANSCPPPNVKKTWDECGSGDAPPVMGAAVTAHVAPPAAVPASDDEAPPVFSHPSQPQAPGWAAPVRAEEEESSAKESSSDESDRARYVLIGLCALIVAYALFVFRQRKRSPPQHKPNAEFDDVNTSLPMDGGDDEDDFDADFNDAGVRRRNRDEDKV